MLLLLGIRFWHPAAPALGRDARGQLTQPPKENRGVHSQVPRDSRYFVEPIAFTGARRDAQAKLEAILAAMPRTAIVAREDGYVRAEQSTALWKFVDDVEAVFDDAGGVIHMRSMARQGDGDMGVNRRRIEAIRTAMRA